jgi:hypothetical protein
MDFIFTRHRALYRRSTRWIPGKMNSDNENFGVWMNSRVQEVGLHKFDGLDFDSGRLPYPVALNDKEHLIFEKLVQQWEAIEGRTVKVPLDSRALMLPDARLLDCDRRQDLNLLQVMKSLKKVLPKEVEIEYPPFKLRVRWRRHDPEPRP